MLQLLRNAQLYTPEWVGMRDLLVGGEQILWIGIGLPPLPPEIDVVERDLAGRRVLPGLIDGHVHLTGGGGEAGARTRVPPLALTQLTLGGVTTAVGVLGTDDTTRSTADLLAAARALNELGITAYCHAGGYHLPPVTITGTVRGDITHIEAIIGVGEIALSDHRSSQPSLDDLLRLASEAHVAGMMTGKAGIVHLHIGDGPRGLDLVRQALEVSELPPRVFNPTHVNRRRALFDEALDLARRGCTIDITAFPAGDEEDGLSAPDALLRYLHASGPAERVTISSDGGGCLPAFDPDGRMTDMAVARASAMAEALTALLRRSEKLERVLPAFTSNVAQLLRLPRKGRLEVGCDADLIVLDERHGVSDVMARGSWHVTDGQAIVRGPFEPAPR